jgi:hypothetical protein
MSTPVLILENGNSGGSTNSTLAVSQEVRWGFTTTQIHSEFDHYLTAENHTNSSQFDSGTLCRYSNWPLFSNEKQNESSKLSNDYEIPIPTCATTL